MARFCFKSVTHGNSLMLISGITNRPTYVVVVTYTSSHIKYMRINDSWDASKDREYPLLKYLEYLQTSKFHLRPTDVDLPPRLLGEPPGIAGISREFILTHNP